MKFGLDAYGDFAGERFAIADRKQVRTFAFCFAILLILLATFFPAQAWGAWFVDDVLNSISTVVIAPMISEMSYGIATLFGAIGDMTIIGEAHNTPWNEIFAPFYQVLVSLQKTAITPVAMQILTLSMMIRLLGITKIAESQDMSPLVPKVASTLIIYFFMMFLVANATSIITVGWDLFTHMIDGVNLVGTDAWDSISAITTEQIEESKPTIDGLIIALGGSLIILLAMALAYGIAVFAYYSKIIKLYFHAFTAPIGLSFFGVESTKQWGLTYIKNVGVNLLSLVFVYVILKLFPYIMTSVISAHRTLADTGTGNVLNVILTLANPAGALSGWTDLIVILVISILLIVFLVKSSSLAREALGG